MVKTLKRFWNWINADRKRLSFACVMTLFGLLLWSRLILVSNLPRTAIADDKPEAGHVVPNTTNTNDSQDLTNELSDNPREEATHVDIENVPKAEPRAEKKGQGSNANLPESSREEHLD